MNFDDIRNMNNEQLKKYLNCIANNKFVICCKCEKPVSKYDRRTISMGIYDKELGQKSRQLCSLCYDCFVDLLDFLAVNEPDF